MSQPKVEIILKNCCKAVGEAPYWDEASQSLLYVDIGSMDVHRWNSVTGEDQVKHLRDTVSFVIPRARRKNSYLVGLGRRVSLLEWDTGMISTVQEVEHDQGSRFNDGKCDPRGRLWAGTMGAQMSPGVFEPVAGALYMLDLDRSIEKKERKVDISNGLGWTEDQRTMYYIDTTPRKLYAYDYDATTGDIKNRRVVVDFASLSREEYGMPDGMTTDNDGKIWVACYGAGAVFRFDPKTGKCLQKVTIPGAKQTTSVCWGGKNYDEMYVTSGSVHLTEEEKRTTQPNAGSLFKITGLGTRGKAAYAYQG